MQVVATCHRMRRPSQEHAQNASLLVSLYKIIPVLIYYSGPFESNQERNFYKKIQRITVQKSPGEVSIGRVLVSKDAMLSGDLWNVCKPGDEIKLTGFYSNSYDSSLNAKNGFLINGMVIIAKHIVIVRYASFVAFVKLTHYVQECREGRDRHDD